ncbi:hypothetical protein OCAE111667_08310 [Occultella aeris]|uniref:DUF4232 domain-containing protein n=1 Tax=Occultella aeris TaxID=2761496 RepID=A0A7M4DKB3_9MICO|nr:hypothetical protein [Occultella aeris]VZO37511.1 hypothetical protein HALOF300_02576 [Occultella aeris]
MTSQTRGKSSRQRSAPAAGGRGAGRRSASRSASATAGTASRRTTATATARSAAGTTARGTTTRSTAGSATRATGSSKSAAAPGAGGAGAKGRSAAGGSGRGGPNGPTRGTYLRRRLVVLLIAAAVIAAITFGVTRFLLPALSAGDPPTTVETSAGGAEPTPTDGATDAATGAPDEDALSNPVSCVPAAVGLTLTPAAASTAAGSGLGVAVEIVNAGQVACLLDVGAGALTLEVYSGEDRVWSTQDCPVAAAELPVLLDTGAAQSASFTWPGTRSAAGCPGGQPVAGAGTYRLVLGLTTDGGPVTTEQAFTVS